MTAFRPVSLRLAMVTQGNQHVPLLPKDFGLNGIAKKDQWRGDQTSSQLNANSTTGAVDSWMFL